MKTEIKKLYIPLSEILLFVLWTIAVKTFDVAAIGPKGTEVGFAAINGFVHEATGINMSLYFVTDWLSLVPVAIMLGFALLGSFQWIKRRKITKVDKSILLLGAFYVVLAAVYLFFEVFIINYRPVLIDGVLEASYPSSTTVLMICVLSTAALELEKRIKNNLLKNIVYFGLLMLLFLTVIMRFFSGVHWLTDIIGGIIIGRGLVDIYKLAAENRQ